DHMLYMTVKKRGNRPESFFSAGLQGNPADLALFFNASTAFNVPPLDLRNATYAQAPNYNSQWTEELYYLVRTGSTEEPKNPASVIGTPIFGLYRAQFVMVPDPSAVS